MQILCKNCSKSIDTKLTVGAKVVVVCPDCSFSNKFIVEAPVIEASIEEQKPKKKNWFLRLFNG